MLNKLPGTNNRQSVAGRDRADKSGTVLDVVVFFFWGGGGGGTVGNYVSIRKEKKSVIYLELPYV